MPDINPSAENIRATLTETLGRIRDQAQQFCKFMQRNVTATFDLGDKLIQAKDMQDAAKIQSEFFQEQMRTLTDQARSASESAMKAASGMFTPKS